MFTTDTRKSYSPIRIVYSSAGVGPYHASELHDRPTYAGMPIADIVALAVVKGTEHGDYSGSDVEASNYRVLHEKFPDLLQIYGSHGYEALAYDATLGPVPGSEELCEILENLEDCPLVDEDDHSEFEMELETEAWTDHGRKDFRKALTSLLDSIDDEHEHEIPEDDQPAPSGILDDDTSGNWDGMLTGLWHHGCDALNVNGGSGFEVETGQQVYFYIDDWCAKAGADKRYAMDKPIHGALRKLAEATRIVDEDGVVLG